MTEQTKEPAWMQLARDVSDNPGNIKWPVDRWNFTSDLRKAIARAASGMGGHPDKEDLLIGTLMVALAHVKKRRDKDRRIKAQRNAYHAEQAAAREPMERFGLQTVTPNKEK